MGASEDNGFEACFPESAYDDYVLDRVPTDRRAGFEEHVRQCPSCSARLAEARILTPGIRDLVAGTQIRPVGECPSDVMVALYLDGTLDEEARTAMDEHLSTCRGCLQRLVDLYLEVHRAMDPEGDYTDILGDRPVAQNAVPLVRPPVEQASDAPGPSKTVADSSETPAAVPPSASEIQSQFQEKHGTSG